MILWLSGWLLLFTSWPGPSCDTKMVRFATGTVFEKQLSDSQVWWPKNVCRERVLLSTEFAYLLKKRWLYMAQLGAYLDMPIVVSLNRLQLNVCLNAPTVVLKSKWLTQSCSQGLAGSLSSCCQHLDPGMGVVGRSFNVQVTFCSLTSLVQVLARLFLWTC